MRVLFKRLFRLFILSLCMVCVGSAFLFAYMRYGEYESLKTVEKDLLKSIEAEEKAQEQLELEMEYSMTDSYIERAARERLGLVKSTDIIFVNENE